MSKRIRESDSSSEEEEETPRFDVPDKSMADLKARLAQLQRVKKKRRTIPVEKTETGVVEVPKEKKKENKAFIDLVEASQEEADVDAFMDVVEVPKEKKKENKAFIDLVEASQEEADVDAFEVPNNAQDLVDEDVQEFLAEQGGHEVLPYVASYLLAIALPGAQQLPLFRALLNDYLVLGSSLEEPENPLNEFKSAETRKREAEKRRRMLIWLFYEGRATLAARNRVVPPFRFSRDTYIVFRHHWPEFASYLQMYGINKDDASDKFHQPSASYQEIEELRIGQAALARECSNESSRLYGRAMGMVSMFSSEIQIDDERRGQLIGYIRKVLKVAVVLMPPESVASSTPLQKQWKKIIKLILELHADKILHLCAELVLYVVQRGVKREMRKNAVFKYIRAINTLLGPRFPVYLFSYDLVHLTREEFDSYKFVGDFDTYLSGVDVRSVIATSMKSYAKFALVDPLHDHQRELAIDMVIQEFLPDEIVKEKQAGMRGLLVYAAPGTGKTLTSLFAAAYLKSIGRAPNRKTLLLLPPSATAAFIDDAYVRFKEHARPRLYAHDTSKRGYVRLKSAKEPSESSQKAAKLESTLADVDFLVFQYTGVAEKIPFGVATSNIPSDKTVLANQMREVVNQGWRVFIDESQHYSNRLNFEYLFIRNWLARRHSTYLLTGTAFVKDYYGIMSQVRLLGYQAKFDLSLPPDMRNSLRKLDEGVPKETLDAIVNTKVSGVAKSKDLRDFTKEDRQREEEIIGKYKSVPILRAIRRIHANVLQNVATAPVSVTEFFAQPYQDSRDTVGVYEKLEKIYDFLFEERLERVNNIIRGLEHEDLPAGQYEKVDDGTEKITGEFAKFLDETGLAQLSGFVAEYQTLLNTRNYGVDLRVLSGSQLSTGVARRITLAKNRIEKMEKKTGAEEEMLKLLTAASEEIKGLKVYRPNKNQGDKKKEEENGDLALVERMANHKLDHGNESVVDRDTKEREEIRQIVKFDVPPRFESVFRRMATHFDEDDTHKGVIFATDKDVMQSFALWLLRKENFRIFRNHDPKFQKEDEAAFPDANYVLFYSAKNNTEERRQYLQDFKDNKRVRLVITTVKLASTGLNLQNANLIVLLQELSNDADYIQTRARLIRLGQLRKVTVLECYSKNTGEIIQRAMRYRRRMLANEFDRLANEKISDELSKLYSFTKEDNEKIIAALSGPRTTARPFEDIVNAAVSRTPLQPPSFLHEVLSGVSSTSGPPRTTSSSPTKVFDVSSSSEDSQHFQPLPRVTDKGKEPERKPKSSFIDLLDA